MNLTRTQLDAIVDALTVMLPARAPADVQLRQFFREHKNLGQRDRALVADTVYAALRRRRLLEHVTPARHAARDRARRAREAAGRGPQPDRVGAQAREKALARRSSRRVDLDELPFEIRADLPDWVIERLRKRWTTRRSSRSPAACSSPRRSTCA